MKTLIWFWKLFRIKPEQRDYQKISNADSIWKETVCDMHNEDCVWRKCENCIPRSIEKLFQFYNVDTVIQYCQWETLIVGRKDKKDLRTTKKMMKRLVILKSKNANFTIPNTQSL